jgi:hypothetical protein
MEDEIIWRYDGINMKMTEVSSGDSKMGLQKQGQAKKY